MQIHNGSSMGYYFKNVNFQIYANSQKRGLPYAQIFKFTKICILCFFCYIAAYFYQCFKLPQVSDSFILSWPHFTSETVYCQCDSTERSVLNNIDPQENY